jgi:CheY-like chemotaxis protein
MTATETLSIVVVDDDHVDRRMVTRSIRQRGIANPTVEARDGLEALALLRGEGGRISWPYVVLLDINMPRLGGLGLLEQLRADPVLRGTVVFMLTTSDDDRDIAAAYANQVAGYIVKSDAGKGLVELTTMLEQFRLTVSFPTDRDLVDRQRDGGEIVGQRR